MGYQYFTYYRQLFNKDHHCTTFLLMRMFGLISLIAFGGYIKKNDFMAFLSYIASKYYIHCVSHITCQYLSRKSVLLVLAML